MIDGHGDDSYKYSRPITANFSSNVYSKVNLSRLKAHLCECIGEIGNYPEPEPYTLEARIASRCQLPSGAVCVTNGATEAIYLIAQTFRGTNTAILQPTFSEYADACRMHGHRVTSLYQLPQAQDGYLLPDDVRMFWLCNPNNPTGQTTEKELLIRVMNRCNKCGTILVLDECFIEFLEEPERYECREYLTQYPNVVIIKAFTKIFCMPGVRLGYALCENAALRKRMRAMLQPWNVSVTAQEAGVAALVDCEAYLKRTREYIKKEKFWMTERMRKLGLNVWGSEANYIFFKGKAGLYEKALKSGLLIRDCSNYEGLTEGHYRIAIRSEEENERLITWLEKL